MTLTTKIISIIEIWEIVKLKWRKLWLQKSRPLKSQDFLLFHIWPSNNKAILLSLNWNRSNLKILMFPNLSDWSKKMLLLICCCFYQSGETQWEVHRPHPQRRRPQKGFSWTRSSFHHQFQTGKISVKSLPLDWTLLLSLNCCYM